MDNVRGDKTILHLMTQDNQPCGSSRRCCEMCGIMIWPHPQPAWTSDRKMYQNPPEKYVACRELSLGLSEPPNVETEKSATDMHSLYAASFDPITKGHEWIIAHAPGHLTVAVANNASKKHHFTLQQRLDLVFQSTINMAGYREGSIEVVMLDDDTYLAEFAKARQIAYLIRGVRGVRDYEYEKAYADVNRTIQPGLIHLLMVPPPELVSVSSSVVHSLVGPKGWEAVVSKYVSPHVLEALRAASPSSSFAT
jgi:pantetheine-phosphate adenylyltransferase